MTELKNQDHMDRLLHDYFHAEVPAPWPAPRLPGDLPVARHVPARSLLRHSGRLAVAASITLLLLGYLALASLFPSERSTPTPAGPTIGLKQDHNESRP